MRQALCYQAGRFVSEKSAIGIRQSAIQPGFTLLELVVVVAILGVVCAVALPALGDGLRRWRLHGAVREVATILKFARNQTVAGRASVQVVFDRSRNVYWLDRAESGLRSTLDEVREKGIRLYAMPAGIRLGEVAAAGADPGVDRAGIVFYPRGNATGAEVEVRDERGRTYRISVDSMTGHARIER
jgi:prepilin-type N-terminal cleavage/methylation domain-containing protein